MVSKKIRTLSIVTSAMVIFSSASGVKAYARVEPNINNEKNISINEKTLNEKDNINSIIKDMKFEKVDLKEQDQEEVVRVIVEVEGKSAVDMSANGGKINLQDVSKIKNDIKSIQAKASNLQGAKIRHSYGTLINGFSMDIKRKEMNPLKKISGVVSVKEANVYYLDMTNAKDMTQVYTEWSNYGYKGEGTVVSIIDSGVDHTHKDMRAPQDPSKNKLNESRVRELVKSGALEAGQSWLDKTAVKGYYTDKVPFGFNYSDDNEQIIDIQYDASMHGMHVAGIVAANASDEDMKKMEGIQGVAPEAQLLGMKVFSNGPRPSAYTDDVVAAIEDSVLIGADVINMSLGSAAGFVDVNDAEQKAIKKASEAGVVVVVSAGNSSYQTAPYNDPNVKDISTAGAPALAKDAFMVANYNNSLITLPSVGLCDKDGNPIKGSDGQAVRFPYAEHTIKMDNGFMLKDIVNCNFGEVNDFTGIDVEGKVALIKRGNISFAEKIVNAQKAGAKAVIMYNNESGEDSLINMAEDPAVNIPAIFVGNTLGKTVATSIANGSPYTIKVGAGAMFLPNEGANDFALSTSWGCAPDLSFKPQISAPGGSIYSTLNNNAYGNMSGTSMSAPHISGAMSIIREALKKDLPTINGKDSVEFAKISVMNTAKPQYETPQAGMEARPFSPRRQGAGMLQLNEAVRNRINVTHNGEASVALKEIKSDKVSFELDIKNYGNKDATYTLGVEGGVLTNNVQNNVAQITPYDDVLPQDKANLSFSDKEITIKANSSRKVTVTLSLKDINSESFIEGFVKFTSKDEKENSNLYVPFMGFYGDWSKDRVISDWRWENPTSFPAMLNLSSGIASQVQGSYVYLGEEDNGKLIDAVISPNGDGNFDTVVPVLYKLRNIKTARTELINKDGKILGEVGYQDNMRKQVYSSPDGRGKGAYLYPDLAWDGTYYDVSKGSKVVPKDGEYLLRYNFYVDLPNSKPQKYDIPVIVDTEIPEVKVLSSKVTDKKEYKLEWEVKDYSGVSSYDVTLNKKKIPNKDIVFDGNKYSVNLNLVENEANDISIITVDKGLNVAITPFTVKHGVVENSIVTFDNIDPKAVEWNETVFDSNGLYEIKGRVSKPLNKLQINGEDVTVKENLTFKYTVNKAKLREGTNNLRVYAENLDGTIASVKITSTEQALADYAIKIFLDTEDPVMNLTSPTVSENGEILIGKDKNYVDLQGWVGDSGFGYTFYINNKVVKKVSVEGEYGVEKSRYDFNERIEVKEGDKIQLKVEDMMGHAVTKTLTVKASQGPDLTVTGIENGKAYKSVRPKATVDRKVKVKATLNEKSYTMGTLIYKEGDYELKVTATAPDGTYTEEVIKFKIDRTAPVVNIKNIENNKVYNIDIVPVIEAEEGAIITATLNRNPYELGTPIGDTDGNYELKVTATDEAGNTSSTTVKFKIKKAGTEPRIYGIDKDKKYYNSNVSPRITVGSGVDLELTLDGNPYKSGTTISEEGEHTLRIKTTDGLGNVFTDEYNFIIDKTPPTIKIAGVEDKGVYNKDVIPNITTSEECKITLTLNLRSYEMGTPITDNGNYRLKVVAVDNAGNKETITIRFSIDKSKNNKEDNGKNLIEENVEDKIEEKKEDKVEENVKDKIESMEITE
ncbi:S8 family serine peptidase [Clostridium sp. Marseille-Q7071]